MGAVYPAAQAHAAAGKQLHVGHQRDCAVVGLVAITPGAGYVAIPQSIFIGFFTSLVSNIAVYLKSKSSLDDTLDVFPCHGVGGMVGMLMTGVFASKAIYAAGSDGWAYGNFSFFLTQLKAMALAVGYSFVVSFVIFKFINFIVPIRVTDKEEEEGLDASQHDEKYLQGTLLVSTKDGIVEQEIHVEQLVTTVKSENGVAKESVF